MAMNGFNIALPYAKTAASTGSRFGVLSSIYQQNRVITSLSFGC